MSQEPSSREMRRMRREQEKYRDEVFRAVKAGEVETVKTILARDRGAVHLRDQEYWTPLYTALFSGRVNYEMAKVLLSHGASADIPSRHPSSFGHTILDMGPWTQDSVNSVNFLLINGAKTPKTLIGPRYPYRSEGVSNCLRR